MAPHRDKDPDRPGRKGGVGPGKDVPERRMDPRRRDDDGHEHGPEHGHVGPGPDVPEEPIPDDGDAES